MTVLPDMPALFSSQRLVTREHSASVLCAASTSAMARKMIGGMVMLGFTCEVAEQRGNAMCQPLNGDGEVYGKREGGRRKEMGRRRVCRWHERFQNRRAKGELHDSAPQRWLARRRPARAPQPRDSGRTSLTERRDGGGWRAAALRGPQDFRRLDNRESSTTPRSCFARSTCSQASTDFLAEQPRDSGRTSLTERRDGGGWRAAALRGPQDFRRLDLARSRSG